MTFSPMSLLLLVKWFDSSLRASFNYATGKKERKKKERNREKGSMDEKRRTNCWDAQ
jgi:hypothetical protein